MKGAAFLAVIPGVLLVAAPVQAQSAATTTGANSTFILLAALAAGIAMFLLAIVLLGSSQTTSRSVQTRIASLVSSEEKSSGFFSRFGFLRRAAQTAESAAQKRGVTNMIESALEQANVPMKAGEAIIAAILASLLGFVLVSALTQSFVWGLVTAAVLSLGSLMFVNNVASRQRKKFEAQLPDTLNLIATSLRAGYSLLQALEAVGQESPDPTRREFGRAIAEIRLGKPIDKSLDDIAARMESRDFEWAVLAIEIQREVGGNLAEVLQTTAETMIQRNRLRREMKALTAEGRLSAIVLSLLPVGVFIFISLSNPSYMEPLLSSTIGLVILGGGILSIGIGVVWMQKIVKVED